MYQTNTKNGTYQYSIIHYICNKSNLHWSGRGLLGLRIPFETHALALQSQYYIAKSLHLLVISYIFTNFTFTCKVSFTSIIFQLARFFNFPKTRSLYFIKNLTNLLCGLIHLVTRSKTSTIRFTAAAGTNLACAYM